MTDEETAAADKVMYELIKKAQVDGDQGYDGLMRGGIVMGVHAGYAAGIEAKRADIKGYVGSLHEAQDKCAQYMVLYDELNSELEAERARSTRLLDTMKMIRDLPDSQIFPKGAARVAVAEYEGHRD